MYFKIKTKYFNILYIWYTWRYTQSLIKIIWNHIPRSRKTAKTGISILSISPQKYLYYSVGYGIEKMEYFTSLGSPEIIGCGCYLIQNEQSELE